MVYKRRKYARRARNKKNAKMRNKRMVLYKKPQPFYMNSKQDVHYFERKFFTTQTISTSFDGVTATSNNITVSLSQLPNYLELVNLFDQYKILGCKVECMYDAGNSRQLGAGGTSVIFPTLAITPDIDDVTSISFSSQLEHKRTSMRYLGDKAKTRFNMYVPPYTLNELTAINSSGTYVSPLKSPWIDTNSSSVPHGCIKYGVMGSASSSYSFGMIFTVRVLCRHSR